jgi:hypothetical protein
MYLKIDVTENLKIFGIFFGTKLALSQMEYQDQFFRTLPKLHASESQVAALHA